MDLSKFPLEVLEVLASYLSAQDLSACSATSLSWRQSFNLDLFWKGRCQQNIVGYLQRDNGLVEPHFIAPTNVDTLQPLCKWRVHFMRKAHLLRNWSKGRHVNHRLQLQATVVNCTLGMDTSGHHWLVVNLGDRTEVWSVQTTPSFYAAVGNITAAPSYLQIVGDKLVVVDFYYFVQVFHLKLPMLGFMPSSKFFYTDSDSVFVDLSDNGDRNSVRDRMQSSFRKAHVLFVVDNLLIGYCSFVDNPKEDFLHIWNIHTETKCSQASVLNALQFKLKMSSCSVIISSDLRTKQLLCSLYLLDKYISKLVVYSLKFKRFTNFSLTISGKVEWCDISGDYVTTSHLLHQLHVYSTRSGNLVHILDTNTRMIFGPHSDLQYQMMDSYMVQPNRDSVKVVNVHNHWDSLFLYFYSVYKVLTVSPKFVAVCARPYVSSNKITLEVWNVKDKIRLFENVIVESNRPVYHMVQPSLTKTAIVVNKTIKVMSFW